MARKNNMSANTCNEAMIERIKSLLQSNLSTSDIANEMRISKARLNNIISKHNLLPKFKQLPLF